MNIGKESDDLTTLANAAQSVDFNWEKAWPKLDQATERLEQLKSLKTKGGLSKENRRQLLTAANELHTMLVAPSSILDNTPDLYKDEFKNRATALTNAYLLFSLDVAPKDNTEKATYLQMLLEKLVKPIREQPSLWGPHSLQITTAAAKWEELQKTVRSSQLNNFNESAPSKTDNESGRLGQSGIRSSGPLPYYNRQDHPYVPQYMYPHPGPYPPSTFIVQAGPIYGHSNQPYGSWNTPSEPFETRPLAQPDTIQYSEGQYTYHTAFPQQRVLPSAHDDIPPGSSNSPVTPTKYFQNQNISNTSPPPFSDAMEIATPQSLLPLRRPKPVPLSIRGRTDFSTTERQHLKDAANLLTEIPRHPAYSSEMRAVHGYAPVAIMEPEEDGEDEPVQLLSPPKRPISADSNKNSIWKRKRTELGVQHILSDGGVPGPSSTAEIERLDRPRSRQEILYQAIAEEQKEDEKFLADNSHHHAEDYENAIAPTPILTDNQTQFPRRQMKRSLSRNDIAVVEDLTPGFRELMSPVPRERSPDRERWRAGSPIPIQQSVPLQEKVVPSHIRSITRPNRQQVALLPPGGNALGARSPELCINASPLETDTRVFMLEHSPPVDIADVMVNIKREIVPMPSGATDMPGLMSIHERTNVLKPVEAREFYVHKRTFIIAKGNERTTPCKDGTIRLGRYFSLSQEEVSETRDYLRHITGSETNRPKTMMRLTCRPRNGEPPGQSVHTWPDNTMVFLNGKCLLTTSVAAFRIVIDPSTYHYTLLQKHCGQSIKSVSRCIQILCRYRLFLRTSDINFRAILPCTSKSSRYSHLMR